MEIEEINNNQEQTVDTDATSEQQGNEKPTETPKNEVNNTQVEEKPAVKTYTQEEVNEKIRARLDRARKSIYQKYGVEDENGLDVMHGKANDYDKMAGELTDRTNKYNQLADTYNQLVEEYAFLKCDVDPNKVEDIKIYFKGKGIEIDEDTLKYEIATHSDWKKPRITMESVGTLKNDNRDLGMSEEEYVAKKLFGLKNGFVK